MAEIDRYADPPINAAAAFNTLGADLDMGVTRGIVLAEHGEMNFAGCSGDADLHILGGELVVDHEGLRLDPEFTIDAEGQPRRKAGVKTRRIPTPAQEQDGEEIAQREGAGLDVAGEFHVRGETDCPGNLAAARPPRQIGQGPHAALGGKT